MRKTYVQNDGKKESAFFKQAEIILCKNTRNN